MGSTPDDDYDPLLVPKVEMEDDSLGGVNLLINSDLPPIVQNLMDRVRVLESQINGGPSIHQVLGKCNRLEKQLLEMRNEFHEERSVKNGGGGPTTTLPEPDWTPDGDQFEGDHDEEDEYERQHFPCRVCPPSINAIYNSEQSLAQHYVNSHPLPPMAGQEVDNKEAPPKTNRNKHKSHPVESRTCPTCHKLFNRVHIMRVHLLEAHSNPPPIQCELCGKEFSRGEAAKVHQKQAHGGVTPTLLCAIKGRIGPRPVRAERPHKCPQENCDKSFKMKKHLNAHLVSCLKLKPYQCDECGASFGFSNVLASHKEFIHQERGREEKEACIICGVVVQKRSMRGHVAAVHNSDGRKYGCRECEMRFKSEIGLKRHLQVHTGERSYNCPIEGCGSSFTTKRGLSTHASRHRRRGSSTVGMD